VTFVLKQMNYFLIAVENFSLKDDEILYTLVVRLTRQFVAIILITSIHRFTFLWLWCHDYLSCSQRHLNLSLIDNCVRKLRTLMTTITAPVL